jgi:hypothetical protein
MRRHDQGVFERAAVEQIGGDQGRAGRIAADGAAIPAAMARRRT